MATEMTEKDLTDSLPLADKMLALLSGPDVRPPAAVAAAALTLAAIAVLAECGPKAPWMFFDRYYQNLAAGNPPLNVPQRLRQLRPGPMATGDVLVDLVSSLRYLKEAAANGYDLHDRRLRSIIAQLAGAELGRIERPLAERARRAPVNEQSLPALRIFVKLGVVSEAEACEMLRRESIDPDRLWRPELDRTDPAVAAHPIELSQEVTAAIRSAPKVVQNAPIPPMSDEELRFFTKQLADDKHPEPLCVVCGETTAACRCSADQLRAWLDKERATAAAVVVPSVHVCSRVRAAAAPPAAGGHLPTCGRDCPGEPACSETWDVVQGASDDELRQKYGPLPIDCECPQCKVLAGRFCEGMSEAAGPPSSRAYHAARGMAAQAARNIARRS